MPVLVAQLVVALGSGFWVALVLLGLPGTWLALAAAAACEWATTARLFHPATLALAVAIAVAGEAWELLASSARARHAGAGRRGALGALGGGLLGAVAGTILLPAPILGTLIGGACGAFCGATLAEHGAGRELRAAARVGRAAAAGHVTGMIGKLAAGALVWCVLAVAVFWP